MWAVRNAVEQYIHSCTVCPLAHQTPVLDCEFLSVDKRVFTRHIGPPGHRFRDIISVCHHKIHLLCNVPNDVSRAIVRTEYPLAATVSVAQALLHLRSNWVFLCAVIDKLLN